MTSILPQILIPVESIKLGRLTTSVDNPYQNYHDPAYSPAPVPTIAHYGSLGHASRSSNFPSILTSLLSKRAKSKVRVETNLVRTYTLQNSTQWFEKAASSEETRQWFERAVQNNDDVYFVVGFHTITDAQIIYESTEVNEDTRHLGLPLGLTPNTGGAIAPLGDLANPQVGVYRRSVEGVIERFKAPGEQICDFQYRKVCYRWFSSRSIDKATLAKTLRWSAGNGWRDEEEGVEDILEMDLGRLDHNLSPHNKAEEVDNPAEASDYQAFSGLSVPAEPQMRKISQFQNYSLHDILHRLHLGVLRLLRPRLGVGERRLEWQCNCGMLLYGDFHGDDEEIDKLVTDIQSHGFLVTQSGHGAKLLPTGPVQTTASHSVSPAPPRPNVSQAIQSSSINISQVVGGMPNTTASGINTAASAPTSANTRPKFVALCVNSGPFQKTYDEVDISSIPKDTQMFHNFKRAYEACRSSRITVIRSWFTKPVDINYIQFAVEGLKRVYPITDSPDCTICAHMKNRDDLVMTRRYECHPAASALAHPPIPSSLFFHLWECPGDIISTSQDMWLNRLPKKLDEKLENVCLRTRPDGEIIFGWGILVIEGIHKRRISRLTTAMVALAIVISVAYSAERKDVSSGFAIGALVVACWTVFITALYFEFQES